MPQLPIARCSKYWGGLLLLFPTECVCMYLSTHTHTADHTTRGTKIIILPPLWQLKGGVFLIAKYFFYYSHGMSTVQALCPVTDPGPSAFHFALHDHPQTNTYICALWIFPVTVPGSCCLPLTHTRSHKPDGSRVGHWPHSLSSGWFGPLGPSRSQLSDHSGLPGIQPRSMASPFYGFLLLTS